MKLAIIKENNMSSSKFKFDVISNPEFLSEGTVIKDTFNGDRIVIGSRSKKAAAKIRKLYEPMDISYFVTNPESSDCELKILKQVIDINRIQRIRPIAILEGILQELKSIDIALLGLSYKAGTDDVREAPSLHIIENLLNKGANVRVYDPKSMENVRKIFGDSIVYCDNAYEAVKGCEAMVLLTEWPEFSELNFKKIRASMKGRIVIDGRNYLDMTKLLKIGFEYFPIGIGIHKAKNEKVPRQVVPEKSQGLRLSRLKTAHVPL